jgi:hypothetical protein
MGRTDIDAAKARMALSLGYWRDISDAARFLANDEEVECMAGGRWDERAGVLVLTHDRVLFVSQRQMQWSVGRAALLRARCDCGAMLGTVTLATDGARMEVRGVDRRDGAAFAQAAGGKCVRTAKVTS